MAPQSPEESHASLTSPTHEILPTSQGSPMDSNDPSPNSLLEQTCDAQIYANGATPSLQDARAPENAHAPFIDPSPLQFSRQTHPILDTSNFNSATEEMGASPAYIKQENVPTPQTTSPPGSRRLSAPQYDIESHAQRQIAALKTENSMRYSSPLRESSVPMPSTEVSAPEGTAVKKRTAPPKTKKGMAVTTKKTGAAKKRKAEQPRSDTPSSRTPKPSSLKPLSGKATPANSSPAPSTRSPSEDGGEEAEEDEDDMDEGDYSGDGDVYCLCRKPDTGTFMIGCDGTCDDWFHGKCVHIDERNKNLIDKYICPNCTEAGIGRTSWKRMCRRGGCRQPARVGKAKAGKKSSKYCSEECGLLYFQALLPRTRGMEDLGKRRSRSRQWSIGEQRQQRSESDDLGARGGVLAAGEIKTLIDSSTTADEFRRLGDGVLSPPATPDGKIGSGKAPDAISKAEHELTEAEQQSLERIARDKDDARNKHQLLKDRMKFVTMAKQAAQRTATERELKPKDLCGYDSRIQWTEEQFAIWRSSTTGHRALETDVLATEKIAAGGQDAMELDQASVDDVLNLDEFEICDRKKCARHLEWPKLAVDGVRLEIGENSDHMRALDREEHDVRERAALRAKRVNGGGWGNEGSVEVHFDTRSEQNGDQATEVEIQRGEGDVIMTD